MAPATDASARLPSASSQKMLALPHLRLKKAARCSEAEDAMPVPGQATCRLYRACRRKACCAARYELCCGTAPGNAGQWRRPASNNARSYRAHCTLTTACICGQKAGLPASGYLATAAGHHVQATGLHRPAPLQPSVPLPRQRPMRHKGCVSACHPRAQPTPSPASPRQLQWPAYDRCPAAAATPGRPRTARPAPAVAARTATPGQTPAAPGRPGDCRFRHDRTRRQGHGLSVGRQGQLHLVGHAAAVAAQGAGAVQPGGG